jgi:hypothetical protein
VVSWIDAIAFSSAPSAIALNYSWFGQRFGASFSVTVEGCVPVNLQLGIEYGGCSMAVKRALTDFLGK